MNDFNCFGDPSRFEIAVRWIADSEPRERRPAQGGWSTGELRLTVGNHVLTRHEFTGNDHNAVRWYLLPFFDWLARNWVPLFHEERLAWRDNHAVPAATAVFMALRRLISTPSEQEQSEYIAVQAWWSRHALRAADSSALFPDLVVRRLVDDIEISWTARQPSFAPDGYRFTLAPGAATLPVHEVAVPLWNALTWAVKAHPVDLDATDCRSIDELSAKIDRLQEEALSAFEQAYLPDGLAERVASARDKVDLHDSSIRASTLPAIEQFADNVLMFGGVNPNISPEDTQTLLQMLAKQAGGHDSNELEKLVDTTIGAPLTAPFEEGYDLAEDLLEQLGLADSTTPIDVGHFVSTLDIKVIEERLNTSTIRGVAIAGSDYDPAIIVNLTSNYNTSVSGQRFTIAHELFHILYDRERARRVTHTSGPWAPPGIEKRANAFSAMLLMPRGLVRRLVPHGDLDHGDLLQMARQLKVGARALLEHLFNIDVIGEFKRDELRTALETAVSRNAMD